MNQYEEAIIYGVLCFRQAPNRKWEQCTKEAITARMKGHIDDKRSLDEVNTILLNRVRVLEETLKVRIL